MEGRRPFLEKRSGFTFVGKEKKRKEKGRLYASMKRGEVISGGRDPKGRGRMRVWEKFFPLSYEIWARGQGRC